MIDRRHDAVVIFIGITVATKEPRFWRGSIFVVAMRRGAAAPCTVVGAQPTAQHWQL